MPRSDRLIRSIAARGSPRLVLICLAYLIGATGCASAPKENDVLPIAAEQYAFAFETAVDAAMDLGMPAALRNRRSGIIETEPLIAASLAEPPRIDRPGGDLLENTVSFRRRRARFEFSPVRGVALDEEEAALRGPDLLALDAQLPDLTEQTGPLELGVRVYLEQAHSPGIRRSTWSRRLTTRTLVLPTDEAGEVLPALFWTPVARDEDLERRLLAAVRHRLRE